MAEERYDNVLIFGAGVSSDAGVPLLGNFVEAMTQLAARDKGPLSANELGRLRRALEIRASLEKYHSRANLDQFNIEDILSVLAFDTLGSEDAGSDFALMKAAVSTTIEQCCEFKRIPETETKLLFFDKGGLGNYATFWKSVLKLADRAQAPAILTFNYDLVLERSLWWHVHEASRNAPVAAPITLGGISHDGKDLTLRFEQSDVSMDGQAFKVLRPTFTHDACNSGVRIPYLKLHGSLSWPAEAPAGHTFNLTDAVPNPLIIPPAFNKTIEGHMKGVWSRALEILRGARNVIFVGYSFPETDTYVRYFLKAGLGGASKLNRILIFDPKLWKDDEEEQRMKERYSLCVARSFLQRVEFRPQPTIQNRRQDGTFTHFVESLGKKPGTPGAILFQ